MISFDFLTSALRTLIRILLSFVIFCSVMNGIYEDNIILYKWGQAA